MSIFHSSVNCEFKACYKRGSTMLSYNILYVIDLPRKTMNIYFICSYNWSTGRENLKNIANRDMGLLQNLFKKRKKEKKKEWRSFISKNPMNHNIFMVTPRLLITTQTLSNLIEERGSRIHPFQKGKINSFHQIILRNHVN